jgi:hypothetical protein
MRKKNVKAAIKANPQAQRHEKAILEALEAVEKLTAAGLPGEGYGLAPAYGGKIAPTPKPTLPNWKMSYCA